ncbi:MAG: SGNH/GDSL hydrolase family protein, partial [Myxococcota bacterium]
VLGGSSSGGGTRGRFWPQVLQERLGDRATVVSLAWGGATTWHLRRILDRLDARAEVCVLYGGHNDTTRSVPGRTIAQVEAGAPGGDGLVAAVSLDEARANVLAMKERCGRFVVIQERVRGREADMAAYAAMLREVPGVDWLDGERLVAPTDLLDDVHLHPRGHEDFAANVHTSIAGMLP